MPLPPRAALLRGAGQPQGRRSFTPAAPAPRQAPGAWMRPFLQNPGTNFAGPPNQYRYNWRQPGAGLAYGQVGDPVGWINNMIRQQNWQNAPPRPTPITSDQIPDLMRQAVQLPGGEMNPLQALATLTGSGAWGNYVGARNQSVELLNRLRGQYPGQSIWDLPDAEKVRAADWLWRDAARKNDRTNFGFGNVMGGLGLLSALPGMAGGNPFAFVRGARGARGLFG